VTITFFSDLIFILRNFKNHSDVTFQRFIDEKWLYIGFALLIVYFRIFSGLSSEIELFLWIFVSFVEWFSKLRYFGKDL